MIWIFIFIVSWGIGVIVCGIAMWFKKYTFAKYAAFIFFGLPVLGLGSEMIQHKMISHNYYAAVEEVKTLCAKDGGDKIYKTVDNVQGVFQMRARKPIRSVYKPGKRPYPTTSDQYGMEDPYGWMQGDYGIEGTVGDSSIFPNAPPFGKQGYWFIEQQPETWRFYRRSYLAPLEKPQDWQIRESRGNPLYEVKKKDVSQLLSRYGYLTEDLTTKEMRDHWIGAGRIKIIDLQTNEVLAERKGYFRASGDTLPYYGIRWSNSYECEFGNPHLLYFLHSVLKPPQDFPTSEQLESIAKE